MMRMHKNIIPVGIIIFVSFLTIQSQGSIPTHAEGTIKIDKSSIAPIHQVCEYKTNPLGIDVLQPRFGWILNSKSKHNRAQFQTAYHILVSDNQEPLKKNIGNIWDTGKIDSDETNQITYAGKLLESRKKYWWKVKIWDNMGQESSWSKPAYWTMGLLEPTDWQAQWISYEQTPPENYLNRSRGLENKEGLNLPPSPYLRKIFALSKSIKQAYLYASALGLCELHLNGKIVNPDRFIPGWTDYHKRVYYHVYDVTQLINSGKENALGIILGDGWYAGYYGFAQKRENYGKHPRALAQLEIEYQDGTREIITTDSTWKASYGPIMEADLLQGELYDATLETQFQNWDEPEFNESQWSPITINPTLSIPLNAYPGIPVQVTQELPVKKITQPAPGVYLFDLGQNMVGCARLKIKDKKGTKIILRYGEMLNPDGTLYTRNLRSARATDVYYVKGKGTESWVPRFTFHGFRYVELTGCSSKPGLEAITGLVMHNPLPETGSFTTSYPLFNRLFQNIVWGQRGNYLEVPTDCPQRDERLGWTGDAQVFISTASYNMDISTFFTKWLVDLNDAQRSDGAYPDVAPEFGIGFGTSAWGDAGIICPYVIYKTYNDKRILEKYYPQMAKSIDYLKQNSKNLIRPDSGYGDWLSINADTPKDLIGTAYFAHVTQIMKEIAHVLGKTNDESEYQKLFNDVRIAFNKAYVSDDGHIKGDTQTGYLLALQFNLLSEDNQAKALEYLVENLKSRKWHLSTGFVGSNLLLPTLTRFGKEDIAYRIAFTESYPSWLYPVKQGATTIWERWDGWTKEKGFQDPSMNSFNHYAYGCIGEWMYSTIGGIQPDGPGYKKIIIHPVINKILTYANTSYQSIQGKIVSNWKIRQNKIILDITIPINTRATVYIPTRNSQKIKESGKLVSLSKEIKYLTTENKYAIYQLGSGNYHFISD